MRRDTGWKEIVLKVICNVFEKLWSGAGSVTQAELKQATPVV